MPACKICKRIIPTMICPVCKEKGTNDYKGIIIIFDTNSEIAKKMNISEEGEYAVKV
ncbi:MAG: transcription elongation factor subunit Spt4 [Candidatus Aenigmatarchaeota archaeon]|nr:DNA-directed RNA polymerase subunit E'' [Candidatus Aenigmarchaeota archaeon]